MDEAINICLIDFDQQESQHIKLENSAVYHGSAGSKVEIKYTMNSNSAYCLLNHDYPPNLHEYNIVVLNMIDCQTIPYKYKEHQRDKVSTDGESKLEISHPTNVFDPRPLALFYLGEELLEFSQKKGIVVVFAEEEYKTVYHPVHFKKHGYPEGLKKIEQSNYSFWPDIPLKNKKHGKKYKIVTADGALKQLIQDFSEIKYYQTFNHPNVWNREHDEKLLDPNFFPLMVNHSGEIIAYYKAYRNISLFVFPDIMGKGAFTHRLLTEVAPKILPELFSKENSSTWFDDKQYWLPNHSQILKKEFFEKQRHKKAMNEIRREIDENISKYKFLHDLITETGEVLVDAVVHLLKFLGFTNVKKMDETKSDGLLEEDVQVQFQGKLLVIEIKGIGGTSTDNDCAQISKIRLRRMKERKSTDVYGLYIVNHERYKPPLSRCNPPFNETQIQDAINDDRGLVTTWDLYKLYFDIVNGIFTKDEVLEKFYQYGLVSFRDDLLRISKIEKTYKNNTVVSIQLENTEVKKGDIVFSEKDGWLNMHQILSLQKNKTEFEVLSNGSVGVLLDNAIAKNSTLYLKKKA